MIDGYDPKPPPRLRFRLDWNRAAALGTVCSAIVALFALWQSYQSNQMAREALSAQETPILTFSCGDKALNNRVVILSQNDPGFSQRIPGTLDRSGIRRMPQRETICTIRDLGQVNVVDAKVEFFIGATTTKYPFQMNAPMLLVQLEKIGGDGSIVIGPQDPYQFAVRNTQPLYMWIYPPRFLDGVTPPAQRRRTIRIYPEGFLQGLPLKLDPLLKR